VAVAIKRPCSELLLLPQRVRGQVFQFFQDNVLRFRYRQLIKFGDFSFSRFGFMVFFVRTNSHTEIENASHRLTRATVVGVSNNQLLNH